MGVARLQGGDESSRLRNPTASPGEKECEPSSRHSDSAFINRRKSCIVAEDGADTEAADQVSHHSSLTLMETGRRRCMHEMEYDGRTKFKDCYVVASFG
jgi:hypothetical protein